MDTQATIGSAVINRLHQLGVRHIFGIPGDYVLSLYQLIERSPIRHIGTTREDCAGFAADAYARINGVGAACVTYCVGGLNCVNAIACAYAERSPVILLTGSPGLSERICTPYMHHMVRDFSTQKEVFEKITVARVGDRTVTLGELADVRDGQEEPRSLAVFNGNLVARFNMPADEVAYTGTSSAALSVDSPARRSSSRMLRATWSQTDKGRSGQVGEQGA